MLKVERNTSIHETHPHQKKKKKKKKQNKTTTK